MTAVTAAGTFTGMLGAEPDAPGLGEAAGGAPGAGAAREGDPPPGCALAADLNAAVSTPLHAARALRYSGLFVSTPSTLNVGAPPCEPLADGRFTPLLFKHAAKLESACLNRVGAAELEPADREAEVPARVEVPGFAAVVTPEVDGAFGAAAVAAAAVPVEDVPLDPPPHAARVAAASRQARLAVVINTLRGTVTLPSSCAAGRTPVALAFSLPIDETSPGAGL